MVDFKEYILTIPDIAPALPQSLSGFFMQLHIPQVDIDALAVLNVAMVPPEAANTCSIVLTSMSFERKPLRKARTTFGPTLKYYAKKRTTFLSHASRKR